jgi:hypothetical protein
MHAGECEGGERGGGGRRAGDTGGRSGSDERGWE